MPLSHRPAPILLIGAFDRHNFGDLLFPHVAGRLFGGDNLLYAGVAERDLRPAGGFKTRALSRLARELDGRPLNIVHAGGEVLCCDAWQAAVMVQPSEQLQALLQRPEGDGEERAMWTRKVLGLSARAPYMASRQLFPGAEKIIYTAVGGVGLDACDVTFRAEVVSKLKEADYISVRDRQTRAHLREHGITPRLVPDPAVMVAELFGEPIRQAAQSGEVATIQAAFPKGYLAVQYSADYGDDKTLREMAAQLDAWGAASGQGVVLFRAGAAPWHDDLGCYRRLAGFMRSTRVHIFASLNLWEICAVIARSAAFCGSSLHGRIIAMAFGLPRLNLRHPDARCRTGKQESYAETWELPGLHTTVDVGGIAAGLARAMAHDRGLLQQHASTLAARYREEFTAVQILLEIPPEDHG